MPSIAIRVKVLLSPMTKLDWNLLPGLHALLDEGSVSRAADRLGITVPSMSRLLARLRTTLGDPLLVRAGRGLVLTSYAASLRERVTRLAHEGGALLAGGRDALPQLERTLTIRANDGMIGPWLEPLVRAVRARAPRLTLAFVAEGEERPDDLREGRVDLDLGVVDDDAPELRTQVLLRDAFVGVVRRGHPILRGKCTPQRLAAHPHVAVTRRGLFHGPIDRGLRAHGVAREVVATVPNASAAAVAVACAGDGWITALPLSVAEALRAVLPIAWFRLPLALPELTISQTWHPRFDRDPAHELLRDALRELASTIARSGRSSKR